MLERLTSPCTRRAKAHARDGRRLADKVIHLVGPGGAGKSTVGSALASRLDLLFIDLDLIHGAHRRYFSSHRPPWLPLRRLGECAALSFHHGHTWTIFVAGIAM